MGGFAGALGFWREKDPPTSVGDHFQSPFSRFLLGFSEFLGYKLCLFLAEKSMICSVLWVNCIKKCCERFIRIGDLFFVSR